MAMQYAPSALIAFESIERVMREIDFGWFIRYVHSNGASFFFFVVYIHMLRGLWYLSYLLPRQIVWYTGVIIYLIMMATAFMGYVLP
jgi:quinol-cytochrome oxidoreductase complex cytochrome b subunit